MILTTTIREIFIAQHAVDFRNGADGLLAQCYAMELDPYEGDCVVFIHRRRCAIKVIGGDAHGVWVLLRRFEGGALRKMFPFLEDPSFVSTSIGELSLLLEGATCEVKAVARPWRIREQGDKAAKGVLKTRSHGKKKNRETRCTSETSTGTVRGIRQGLGVGEGAGGSP